MTLFCDTPAGNRRTLFWTTQPDGCGTSSLCGNDCGTPGLAFADTSTGGGTGCNPVVMDGCVDPCAGDAAAFPRTLATNDWVRSLLLNMFMTDGREADNECGYRPGSQGGHWSESFIQGNDGGVGTLIRSLPTSGTVNELVALVATYAQSTAQKLVSRGVALAVDAQATYAGNGIVDVTVTVTGRDHNKAVVGLTGERLQNGWVWNT